MGIATGSKIKLLIESGVVRFAANGSLSEPSSVITELFGCAVDYIGVGSYANAYVKAVKCELNTNSSSRQIGISCLGKLKLDLDDTEVIDSLYIQIDDGLPDERGELEITGNYRGENTLIHIERYPITITLKDLVFEDEVAENFIVFYYSIPPIVYPVLRIFDVFSPIELGFDPYFTIKGEPVKIY